MGVFIFILLTLLLSILIIIIGSTLQFSVIICTGKKVEFEQIILPSLLSLISFFGIIFSTHIVLINFNINIISLIYSFLLNIDFTFNNLIYGSFAYLGAFLIFTIIQSVYVKLIYFDYSKIFRKLKENILSLFGKERIKELISSDDINNKDFETINMTRSKISSISFLNSYLVSLLSSAFIFFLCFLFIFLGAIIGNKII